MSFAIHNGVRTHYREEGNGPSIILVGGFRATSDDFYDRGFVDALRDSYHLIIPDMPGRAPSDCPREVEAYSREHLARYLLAVLDATQTERAVFWGYSWGGALGYCLAMVAPERFTAWIIGGQSPYGVDEYAGAVEPLSHGTEAYIASMEADGQRLAPEQRERLLKLDAVALSCAARAMMGFTRQPEALSHLTAPTLFFAGTEDVNNHEGLREAATIVPSSRFVSLPGLNHGAVNRTGPILPHVLPFLAEVTASERHK